MKFSEFSKACGFLKSHQKREKEPIHKQAKNTKQGKENQLHKGKIVKKKNLHLRGERVQIKYNLRARRQILAKVNDWRIGEYTIHSYHKQIGSCVCVMCMSMCDRHCYF